MPEIVPLPTQIGGPGLEHCAGTFYGPGHTGLVQSSLDYLFTTALDRTTSELQASLAISRVVYAVLIDAVAGDGILDSLDLGMLRKPDIIQGFVRHVYSDIHV